ncbi:MAG: hypothetical protein WBX38_13460 [Candidatus Sulfotelmatobacter sp.]
MLAEEKLTEKTIATAGEADRAEKATHSACWAVRRFAAQVGEDISEALLFGLGRTAWYCFRAHAGTSDLLTYHPLRVPRMFMALNVPADSYRCWTSAPLTPAALCGCSGKMLLEVDRTIFAAKANGKAEGDPYAPRHYCVWTAGLAENSTADGWPFVELQVPHCDNPVVVEGGSLARGWRAPGDRAAAYTFYVSHTTGIRWKPRAQTRLCIEQWVHQMRQAKSPYGLGGLSALPAFADALENGSADLERTRRYALADGGAAGHRDLLSGFLFEAAELLNAPVLSRAAASYTEIATAWRVLFGDQLTDRECAQTIREIHVLEYEALEELNKDFVS